MASKTEGGLPPQHQERQPGRESEMEPRPSATGMGPGSGRLSGRTALITGGDSGIGRAVAVAFAREGADVAILYLEEDDDARETRRLVEAEGTSALSIAGDAADPAVCQRAVDDVIEQFGALDVLVGNAAEQHVQTRFEDITPEQLQRTFATNVFHLFHTTRAALPHLRKRPGSIIYTTSVTAYKGSGGLVDYSATKGAIVALTRSLSQQLAEHGIRVNAVAPGPIWTPLIPATFPADEVATFGQDVPLGRPGQPDEVAPSYVFLASDDASYMTGQVLHPNGGTVVNG